MWSLSARAVGKEVWQSGHKYRMGAAPSPPPGASPGWDKSIMLRDTLAGVTLGPHAHAAIAPPVRWGAARLSADPSMAARLPAGGGRVSLEFGGGFDATGRGWCDGSSVSHRAAMALKKRKNIVTSDAWL